MSYRSVNLSKRRKKQSLAAKSILAILLVLLLIGSAVAPVFSEATGSFDSDFKEYVEFMVDYAGSNYYQQIDKQLLIEGAYKGVFEALDKHSTYYTPKEYSAFTTDMSGEFSGIGAVITRGDDYVEIVSPVKETPAFRAGLKTGDKIVSVNGEDAKGWSTEKAVSVIRGPVGTEVTIGILRGRSTEILYFTIKREMITIKTVNYELLSSGIGYIEVTQFGDNTNREFDDAMKYMAEKGIKKLIIDVRNNPGGYLTSAIYLSDYFVEPGQEIVRVVNRSQASQIYRASREKFSGTVVVLVNEGSASASEIFAGSIQLNKSGTIIGSKTYGKGTVQNITPLTNGGGIKLTTAEYLLRDEYHVDGNGVTPDVKISGVTEDQKYLYKKFVPMNEKVSRKRGDTSLNVYGIQQRLEFLGYEIDVDGKFGNQTETYLKKLQTTLGIRSTGILDTQTVKLTDEYIEKIIRGDIDPVLDKALEILNK